MQCNPRGPGRTPGGDTAVLAPTMQIHIWNFISKWCLGVFMQVSAGSPDRNYASPSSSSQLSSFQPFMSISSSSLVKDELLTGVEHTMVSMCPWHSLAQSQWRFLSTHPSGCQSHRQSNEGKAKGCGWLKSKSFIHPTLLPSLQACLG